MADLFHAPTVAQLHLWKEWFIVLSLAERGASLMHTPRSHARLVSTEWSDCVAKIIKQVSDCLVHVWEFNRLDSPDGR